MSALDLRVPFAVCQEAFGVPGTVTRPAPDNTPISTDVVWVAPAALEAPQGGEFQRKTASRVLAIAKADVPTVPRGTLVEAAEAAGGAVLTWHVDETERIDADHVRVKVRPVTGAT